MSSFRAQNRSYTCKTIWIKRVKELHPCSAEDYSVARFDSRSFRFVKQIVARFQR